MKRAGKGGVIGATPVHAMMQSGGGGMQLAYDPAIFAAQNRVLRSGGKLQIAGRKSEFVKFLVGEIVTHNVAIRSGEFVLVEMRVRF